MSPTGPEAGRARPVPTPGAAISNLREVRQRAGGASGLGTLGFLAARAGARDWTRLLLVSNRHVLFAHGAVPGEAIFQPGYRIDGERLMFDADPRPVATLEPGGFEGDWRYAYPGEPERNWFVDCAAAALVDGEEPRAQGGSVLFTSVARAMASNAGPGRGIGVYKLGWDRAVAGRLISVDATVALADGTRRSNNIVIRGLPGPGGKARRFAGEGDSGALVLDRLHRAIGLVWGVSLADPNEAYACHIHPVLDCLKLLPYRRALQSGPGGAAGGRNGAG